MCVTASLRRVEQEVAELKELKRAARQAQGERELLLAAVKAAELQLANTPALAGAGAEEETSRSTSTPGFGRRAPQVPQQSRQASAAAGTPTSSLPRLQGAVTRERLYGSLPMTPMHPSRHNVSTV